MKLTHLWCILVRFGAYFTVSGISCFLCAKTKSRLHTKISTVVSSEAVCASKIHPSRDFSRKAKLLSFANLGECFVVKNPHALGLK